MNDGSSLRDGPAVRILLVEDDALVRIVTAELLVELGYAVIEAGDGAEARRLFADRPDLVITDVEPPDADGLELAAEFRALRPEAAIIVASGKMAGPGPGYVWLQKPYRGATLREAIARALGQG